MTSPVRFPEELPISARVRELAEAIDRHPIVIVAGETGSGKTTQLPKICLAMGRGLKGRIGVTEPRRIAATSVAARVADELQVELGREVGYQIRFQDKTSRETYVKFMTDGILLAELQGDPMLRAYDTIILDEAHERTLNIDFLLGTMKQLSPKRPDLRVIVSSATLEHQRFAEFFGGAPVLEVSGRTYPVEVIYRPRTETEADLSETIAETVEEITSIDPREDILVFLPGEREIHEAASALAEHGLPHTVVLPLYGRLPEGEQAKVWKRFSERKVVLATNVAETSLTIPGIRYVVDAGLARINRYDPRTGVTRLLIEPISRASADQRKGRAGRTQSGVCFRLYEEREFALRPAYTDPELLRVGLDGAILQMKAVGLGAIEDFPFLDPPPKRAVDEGYRTLEEIGAVDDERALTEVGRKLARLPLDPRIGRMILAGEKEGALKEILVLAAALGVQDPRERPRAVADRADQAHRRFRDEESDFGSLLKLWSFYQSARAKETQSQLRRTCQGAFLSYVRLREWSDVHQQLSRIAREMGFKVNAEGAKTEAIHRALLPGLLSKVATFHPEKKLYNGARQTKFKLHPSSGLLKKPPAWIVAAELVETSQLFARTVAKIEPVWLEELGGALCKRSYGDPGWNERAAQVTAREQVSLYGLPIVKERRVHYGPIDPKTSRRVFLLHALVRGEYHPREVPAFQKHNLGVLAEAQRLRDRARSHDLALDEEALSVFFEGKVPDEVWSGKTFEDWRREAELKDPRVLFLKLEDVLQGEATQLSKERYPDVLRVAGADLALAYRFEPSEDDDGIAVSVPLPLLSALNAELLDWTIPAWHVEKIRLLIQMLPKAQKRGVDSLPELAAEIAREIKPFSMPLRASLSRAMLDHTDARVPLDAWNLADLPPYLSLYYRVLDGARVVAEGRDLRDLKARFGVRAADAWAERKRASFEREGATSFPFDTMPGPEAIEVAGMRVLAEPGLVDLETSVGVRAFASKEDAERATRAGLRRLYLLDLGNNLQKLEQLVPAAVAMSSLGEATGGAPRRQLVMRAIDEAFELEDASKLPRTRKAFQQSSEAGRSRLTSLLGELGRAAAEIAVELDRVQADLKRLTGSPGAARASLDDVRSQLRELVHPDLLRRTERSRLAQIPRYLKAIRVRLERLPNGPQKDQAKLEQVAPFWRDWLAGRERLLARGVSSDDLEAFRFLLEELRVAVFAPEVRAAVPVSAQRLAEQWKELSG